MRKIGLARLAKLAIRDDIDFDKMKTTQLPPARGQLGCCH
jgi:hypothetical protein